ncbi:patatin-like phospholipase family protein [Nonomuraea angiospora]|uniref:patatin-like phospholipase family protein n=1 Tax=Nonomuraea angiospora TaxID=46172 RepID=UPI00332A338B
MTSPQYGKALVLGAGGLVGTAWLSGLAAGLRREGVDLAEADLIVGTSAGAIVAAMLTTGRALADVETLPSTRAGRSGPPDLAAMSQAFATLVDPTLEPDDKRRRAGRIALAAEAPSEYGHLTGISSLVETEKWPDRPLLITAVDAETGEPKVWDRDGEATLVEAAASSSAFPGTVAPITVNGRRYMDGALRNGVNADLAATAVTRVFIEPMADRFPASDPRDVRIGPDAEALAAFGPDLGNREAWTPVYRAGVRQAPQVAVVLRPVWDVAPVT